MTVRGTLEQVEERVVRALREQGFGVRRAVPRPRDRRRAPSMGSRYERREVLVASLAPASTPGKPPVTAAPCELVVGELGGQVTITAREVAPANDVVEGGPRGTSLPPDARQRLRAVLSTLEGEP